MGNERGTGRWDDREDLPIELRWRGLNIHAERSDGHWRLSSDGRSWTGPEVIPSEDWGATTARLRAWVDNYLQL